MSNPTNATLERVWERDQGCCARCGVALVGARGLSWSVHHRRPRGAGGSKLAWVNKPANLLSLCGSGVTGCHGWCETNRSFARAAGYLVPLNGVRVASEVPVMHSIHGLVLLTDTGGYESQEVPF